MWYNQLFYGIKIESLTLCIKLDLLKTQLLLVHVKVIKIRNKIIISFILNKWKRKEKQELKISKSKEDV